MCVRRTPSNSPYPHVQSIAVHSCGASNCTTRGITGQTTRKNSKPKILHFRRMKAPPKCLSKPGCSTSPPPTAPPGAGPPAPPGPPTSYAAFLGTAYGASDETACQQGEEETIRKAKAKNKAAALKRDRQAIASLVSKLDGSLPSEFRSTIVRNHAGARALGICREK